MISPSVARLRDDEPASVRLGGRWKKSGQLSKVDIGIVPFVILILILITLPQSVLASFATPNSHLRTYGPALSGRAPNQTTPLLKCLQVSPPVLNPATHSQTQTLMVHTFGYSYGIPFVGNYSPPALEFNRVTFNFTVTSAGRQYDRLALMFFNDTEIFRTSTAEPTQNGIIWTYTKDMSNYLALFKQPQKIIFDLGNLVDDTYTGSWNTTLTATFFTAEDSVDAADVIVPISSRQSAANAPSGFVIPDTKAVNSLTLPQNAKKAVFSISACGQAAEEFWWSNVLSSDTKVFGNDTTLYGYSPFREVQLYIDGTLAGVAWPFPVIFTGGIVPGFWRPVVGIDAFDLREDEIDISAFLPLLSDGQEHAFEIRVAGIDDDGKGNGNLIDTVGSNWVVTGKIFLWLDSEGVVTKGSGPVITAPSPSLKVASHVQKRANGTVNVLDYSVEVTRNFLVTATLETSAGSHNVTWQQNLKYSNDGHFSNGGNDQINDQSTTGSDISSNNYSKNYDYPLWVYSTYNVLSGGNFTIDGKLARGKKVRRVGDLAFASELKSFDFSHSPGYGASFTGTSSDNWQNGTASYLGVLSLKRSFGSGTTEQSYSLTGIGDAVTTVQGDNYVQQGQGGDILYRRHVLAANDTIVLDEESIVGSQVSQKSYSMQSAGKQQFANNGIRAMLGRGPP
ncbi:peptide N-acetyl-beta-D-glucosaminyl asparaginase amidase A-domain-containing protein [Lophiotrema nucula]|uniref:Peptide N-acetyl-beta-D-glucosaminyl asparaginase amidase A-domain-containing protein n=1 Tax=Lophiotrema nucula TaxID=690887 RepID=A0A6A5ZFF5_9PLEO|nr:peptide N-acetyl-beta-D-glucosaminyl asparaginase amidase A-domain-containing protein [Lophiotrema nucula]